MERVSSIFRHVIIMVRVCDASKPPINLLVLAGENTITIRVLLSRRGLGGIRKLRSNS